MPRIFPGPHCRTALLVGAMACAGLTSVAPAQQPGPAPTAPSRSPAAFDPSDVYYQGWLLSKEAEKAAEEEHYLEALDKLRRARGMFETIQRSFPEWKPDMVNHRLEVTDRSISEVNPGAIAEHNAKLEATAELEGGARRSGTLSGAGGNLLDTGIPATPMSPMVELKSLESRRIADLETEVADLKRQLSATADPNGAAREAARATAVERQRDLAVAQLHRAQTELEELRRRNAAAPVREDMRTLQNRIDSLEQEKWVMGRALDTSRSEARQTKAQIDAIQQERVRLMQEVADLKSNLETERQAANEVVAGQRKQLEQMQGQLKSKDQELSKANLRISSLEAELAEVRESFNELREERDNLLGERDRMAALLNLNEESQLQQVIDQNMALDRKLREAEQRYDLLKEDYDATTNDLKEAMRDLVISKIRIQEFRREKLEQDKRIKSLEQRLREDDRALAASDGDPAEVAVLREVIDRQLKIQKKRSEATELLMATLGEKAKTDEDLRRALNLFQGTELNLSPEELKIVDAEEVDDVIISRYARPRAEVDRSMASLEAELAPYEKAGVRAFQNGRLHAAREAFEMIVERHPGDTTSMCKLGLVEYKLNPDSPIEAADTFRRASEVDPRNPYAQRMLGHTLSLLGDYGEALQALERSAELAPTNAQTHLLIGNLQFRLGNLQAAEDGFRTSMACDETLAEAPYNLAVLYQRLGKPRQALEFYARALEHGAAPNLDFEERLRADD